QHTGDLADETGAILLGRHRLCSMKHPLAKVKKASARHFKVLKSSAARIASNFFCASIPLWASASSDRRGQYLSIFGSVRGADEPALLHRFDDLRGPVIPYPELALDPGGGAAARLCDDPHRGVVHGVALRVARVDLLRLLVARFEDRLVVDRLALQAE